MTDASKSEKSKASLKEKLTYPLRVVQKIQETPNAYSYQLEIPQELKEKFSYRAGQFVTLFLNMEGEEIRRSYSLGTSPSMDKEFQITVKQVVGGKGSNFLANKVEAGHELAVTPPQGTFFQGLTTGQSANYYLFAAGSGITPIFSILKEVLKTDSSAKIFLLYANRDENNIIYSEALRELQNQHASQLFITHRLSRPVQQEEGIQGRINSAVAKNFVGLHDLEANKSSLRQAYICGPDGFMDSVREGLTESGFSDQEIRTESFTTVLSTTDEATDSSATAKSSDTDEELDGVVIGDLSSATSEGSKLTALINGDQIEISLDPELSLLENLIEQGHNPPYSCMDGACMACMAKVTEGKVVQDDFGILTDENVEASEALTCQARAASANVRIDYDNL